jgi:hypothetical protein
MIAEAISAGGGVTATSAADYEFFCGRIAIVADYPQPIGIFKNLADRWKHETRLLSNITKKCININYQEIIGMGRAAVPFILADLRVNGPNDWFWALTAITGENPITETISGNMKGMTEAWLLWGAQAGYQIDCHQRTNNALELSVPSDIESRAIKT